MSPLKMSQEISSTKVKVFDNNVAEEYKDVNRLLNTKELKDSFDSRVSPLRNTAGRLGNSNFS